MSDTNNSEVNASSVNNTAVTQTPAVPVTPVPPVATPAQGVSTATNNAEIVQAPAVAPQTPVQSTVQPTAESEVAQKQEEVTDGAKSIFGGNIKQKDNSFLADLVVPEDPNSVASKKDSSQSSSDEEKFELEKENRKLPVAVLIIFAGLLLVVIVYYFIVMTPTKVFDKAIDSIFSTLTGVVDSAKDSKTDTAKLKITVDMETDGKINDFLDGIIFEATSDVDIKNLDLGLELSSKPGKTKISDEDSFNSKVYLKDGGVYVSNEKLDKTYPGKTVLYTDSDFTYVNYDRIDDITDIVLRTKNEIVDIIQNDQLKRTITVKKINGQTTIALKANCTLNNKEIADIYKPIFKKYLQDEKFIKQVTSAIGSLTETEVKDKIKELYERDVVTQGIEVNLYMNLANTQLISLDVTVDDYFVEIDNLNGYFYGLIKYKGAKKDFEKPEFQLQFEYDANKGLLNGSGFIDISGQDYIYSNFDYTRVEENDKKVGNVLNINFYNKEVKTKAEENDKNNIIAKLACTLDIENDNPAIHILGKNDSVPMTDDIEDGITESMARLSHYVEYVFRTLLYNKWSDEKYALEMYDRDVEKKVEKLAEDNIAYDISDLKAEVEEAKNYCAKTDTYAYLINGASKTTGQFDGFPKIEEAALDWICLFDELSEEERKDLNFDYSEDIDYDHFEKVINNKLKGLNINPAKRKVDIESLTITPEKKTLEPGSSVKLNVAYEPTNATKTKITWSSSDKQVATVDESGKVIAKAKGTATITAKSESNKTITAVITVSPKENTSEDRESGTNETTKDKNETSQEENKTVSE